MVPRPHWSRTHVEWRCSHSQIGCDMLTTTTSDAPAYDCEAGFANWEHGWSDAKKVWCCAVEKRGCAGKSKGKKDETDGWKKKFETIHRSESSVLRPGRPAVAVIPTICIGFMFLAAAALFATRSRRHQLELRPTAWTLEEALHEPAE